MAVQVLNAVTTPQASVVFPVQYAMYVIAFISGAGATGTAQLEEAPTAAGPWSLAEGTTLQTNPTATGAAVSLKRGTEFVRVNALTLSAGSISAYLSAKGFQGQTIL